MHSNDSACSRLQIVANLVRFNSLVISTVRTYRREDSSYLRITTQPSAGRPQGLLGEGALWHLSFVERVSLRHSIVRFSAGNGADMLEILLAIIALLTAAACGFRGL